VHLSSHHYAPSRRNNSTTLYADHVECRGVELFSMVCERNLDGIIAK
jgi:hypothetical protein